MTAGSVKFSDAISSIWSFWRAFSASMAAKIAGSSVARLDVSIVMFARC